MNSKNEKELESQTAVERVRKCTLTTCDVFVIVLALMAYTIAIVWYFLSNPDTFAKPKGWDDLEWVEGHPEQRFSQFLYLSSLGSFIVCVIFLIVFYVAIFVTGRLIPPPTREHRIKLFLIRVTLPIFFCALLGMAVVTILTFLVCGSEKLINCNCRLINGLAFYEEGCNPSATMRSMNLCVNGRVPNEKSMIIYILVWVSPVASAYVVFFLNIIHVVQTSWKDIPGFERLKSGLRILSEVFTKVYAVDD